MPRLKPSTQAAAASSSTEVYDFTDERGLNRAVVDTAGLHIATPEGWSEDMLAIPYRSWTGNQLGIRYRRLGEDPKPKYLDEPGAELHMYNPFGAGPGSRVVFFCEGELDVLSFYSLVGVQEYGLDAIGMSGATKYGHEMWQRAWRHLFSGSRIVIATDADEAGSVAAGDIARMFPQAERMQIPEGLDLGEWLVKDQDGLLKEVQRWTT